MTIEFYDVKTRKHVSLSDKDVVKGKFKTAAGRIVFGLRGRTHDGRILTKFVSEADWQRMNVAQESR